MVIGILQNKGAGPQQRKSYATTELAASPQQNRTKGSGLWSFPPSSLISTIKSQGFWVFWTKHVSTKQTLYHSNWCDSKCFVHFSTRKNILVQAHQAHADKVLNTVSKHTMCYLLFPQRWHYTVKTAKEFSPAKHRGTSTYILVHLTWQHVVCRNTHAFWKLSDINEQNSQLQRPPTSSLEKERSLSP